MKKRQTWLVITLMCVAPIAGACASPATQRDVASISTPAAAPTGTGQKGPQDPLDGDPFSRCMKENGAGTGMADITQLPGGNGNGTVAPTGSPVDPGVMRRALDKCKQYLPDGGQPKPLSAAQLEQERK